MLLTLKINVKLFLLKKFGHGGKSYPLFKTPLSSSKEESLQQHEGVIKYILSPQFSLVNSLCLLNVR